MHACQLEVTLPEDSTLKPLHYLSCQSWQFRPLDADQSSPPTNLWYEDKDVTERMKCLENRPRVINSPLMIIVKTWLYCKFYNGMKDRINPAFQWQREGVWVFEQCVCVSLWAFYVSERVSRESGTLGKGGKPAESRQSPDAHPSPHPFEFKGLLRRPLALHRRLCRLFCPFFSPRLLSRPRPLPDAPLYRSLLILPKHIVLFALHVLKVKVAPGHTFVDVLDVVASGLEVSGGIVGAWGEDLGTKK